MAKINQKTFKKALVGSGGNQSTIAKKLEVSRAAITKFLNKNPKIKELVEIEGEIVIDISEDNIDSRIVNQKNVEDSKWKLLHSKRGKERGYGIKQELEHSMDTTSVEINIIKPNENKSKLRTNIKTKSSS